MKPILFNTEMVRAILDGHKSVTRRVVMPQPICGGPNATFTPHDDDFFLSAEKHWLRCRVCGNDPEYSREGSNISHNWKPPYLPGDIMYVRETFRIDYLSNVPGSGRVRYKADDTYADFRFTPERYEMMRRAQLKPGWRPNENMPKEAARLFLLVTGVRVERLQDISEEQAEAEGCTARGGNLAKDGFEAVWDSTIKKADLPIYGWGANPWVWVIEFERISREEALGGTE